ncbi:hypothetical protein EON63_04910 [archaeon]|nr:MAG: hypothetical protein EON63_04910 [archaeon]
MCTYGTGRIYASLTFYDAAEQNIKEAIQSLTDHMPDAFSDLSLLKDFLDMMGCLYREVYMPAAYNTNDTDGVDAVNKRTSWSDKTRGLLSMLSSLITSHNSSAVDGTKSEYVEDEVSTLTCDSDCSENILHTLQSTFTSCEVLAKVLCWSSCRVLHEIVSLAGQIYLQVGMGRVAIKIYACALKACESNGVVMENTCTEDVFNQLAELRRDYVRCILRVCNDGSHATYSTLYHPPGDRLEWLKDAELALTVLTTASHRQEDMELWADLLCLQGGTRNELLSVCLYAACFISQHAEESTEVKCRLAHSLARKSVCMY